MDGHNQHYLDLCHHHHGYQCVIPTTGRPYNPTISHLLSFTFFPWLCFPTSPPFKVEPISPALPPRSLPFIPLIHFLFCSSLQCLILFFLVIHIEFYSPFSSAVFFTLIFFYPNSYSCFMCFIQSRQIPQFIFSIIRLSFHNLSLLSSCLYNSCFILQCFFDFDSFMCLFLSLPVSTCPQYLQRSFF